MIRALTGIGFALALVGSAHAQDQQVTVRIDGKSHQEARSAIYLAAKQVCAGNSVVDPLDTQCINATYADALRQLRALPTVEQTAYIQAAPASLR